LRSYSRLKHWARNTVLAHIISAVRYSVVRVDDVQ